MTSKIIEPCGHPLFIRAILGIARQPLITETKGINTLLLGNLSNTILINRSQVAHRDDGTATRQGIIAQISTTIAIEGTPAGMPVRIRAVVPAVRLNPEAHPLQLEALTRLIERTTPEMCFLRHRCHLRQPGQVLSLSYPVLLAEGDQGHSRCIKMTRCTHHTTMITTAVEMMSARCAICEIVIETGTSGRVSAGSNPCAITMRVSRAVDLVSEQIFCPAPQRREDGDRIRDLMIVARGLMKSCVMDQTKIRRSATGVTRSRQVSSRTGDRMHGQEFRRTGTSEIDRGVGTLLLRDWLQQQPPQQQPQIMYRHRRTRHKTDKTTKTSGPRGAEALQRSVKPGGKKPRPRNQVMS